MPASSGFCSDGTSREYTEDEEDAGMLSLAGRLFGQHSMEPRMGKVWTTDALYREFPSKIAYWRNRGASLVNMDTSSFYAVAREKGIRAVHISLVSDYVGGDVWSGWLENSKGAVELLWDVCLDIAHHARSLE